jgi:hypothetical protein
MHDIKHRLDAVEKGIEAIKPTTAEYMLRSRIAWSSPARSAAGCGRSVRSCFQPLPEPRRTIR